MLWTDSPEGPQYSQEKNLEHKHNSTMSRFYKHQNYNLLIKKTLLTYPFSYSQLRHGPSCSPLSWGRSSNSLWKVSRFSAALILGSFQGVVEAQSELCLKKRRKITTLTILSVQYIARELIKGMSDLVTSCKANNGSRYMVQSSIFHPHPCTHSHSCVWAHLCPIWYKTATSYQPTCTAHRSVGEKKYFCQ